VLSWAAFTVSADGRHLLCTPGRERWEMTDALTGPVPRRASIEGNLAAVVGQLQLGEQSTDAGRLRVDSREILAATTRLIGARLGELEVDTHIVVTTRYIERGTPDDFMADLTKGGVVRALYGPLKSKHGGKNLENVHRALVNLYRLEVQFEGFNAITGEHDPDLASMSRLYTDLVFDRQIRLRRGGGAYDPAVMGGTRDGTVQVALGKWHARQLQRGYWVELDWEKLRSLSGLAKTLWLLFSSPRVPFRPAIGAPGLEEITVPLDLDAYRALGINTRRERDCKRRLEEAGRRLVAVDELYVDFAVTPDPARPGAKLLTVVRRCAQEQLVLGASVAA
jgi:hypothetical protein